MLRSCAVLGATQSCHIQRLQLVWVDPHVLSRQETVGVACQAVDNITADSLKCMNCS